MLTESQRSGAITTPSTGARISPDGRFEFPNVAPGELRIQADAGKSTSAREGDFVSQFVTVSGTNVADVLLQSTPGSSISGRLIFDGDPAPSTRGMGIEPAPADPDRTPLSNGSIGRADVRPDLTFAMDGIHGPRHLTVANPPAGWMLKSVVAAGVDVTDVALPFGTRDQSLSDVIVVLTNRLTELSGTVSDSRGQLVTDCSVLIFSSDRDRWYAGSRSFRLSRHRRETFPLAVCRRAIIMSRQCRQPACCATDLMRGRILSFSNPSHCGPRGRHWPTAGGCRSARD